jgi:nitrite reductase (NO-forming)
VDHHFANASQGAVGIIAAGGMAEGGADHEHHNIPATAAPTDAVAVRGKLAFETKCLACHTIAGGDKMGPDIYKVTARRDEAWLKRWLKDPEGMVKTDPVGKELLGKYKVPMPNQNLTDAEIAEYLAYFKWADANVQPRGKTQPQPAAPGSAKAPSQTFSATPMTSGGEPK